MILKLVTTFLCFLVVGPIGALSLPQDSIWSDERTTPFYYATHANDHHRVDLLIDGETLRISVLDKDKSLFTFTGHEHTVFSIVDNTLWYVEFSTVSSGGNVIAVNLLTGQQLWKTRLEALPPAKHSRYSNLMNMQVFGKNISVYGKETYGQYMEVLDSITGRQIAHTIIEDEKK